MSLPELLQQWAEAGERTTSPYAAGTHPRVYLHSPGQPDGWCVVHSGFAHGWRVDPSRDLDRAHILTAALEAVHARGWDCRLTSGTPRAGEWHAIVWIDAGTAAHRRSFDGYGASPAEALLAAYLKAIAREAV